MLPADLKNWIFKKKKKKIQGFIGENSYLMHIYVSMQIYEFVQFCNNNYKIKFEVQRLIICSLCAIVQNWKIMIHMDAFCNFYFYF